MEDTITSEAKRLVLLFAPYCEDDATINISEMYLAKAIAIIHAKETSSAFGSHFTEDNIHKKYYYSKLIIAIENL